MTFARSTTAPLGGQASFLLTSPGTVQGQGASYDFTIDAKDKAKVLQISFDYVVNSGTFVAGTSTADSDLIAYIYNVGDALLLEPSSIKLLSNSTTLADKFQATFQTSATSTTYRLILHSATSSAAYSVKLKNITVSPSNYVYGSPITNDQTYNPSISSAFGTVTNYTTDFKWSQAGEYMWITGNIAFTGSSGTWSQLRFSLPPGFTAAYPTGVIEPEIGEWNAMDSGIANYGTGYFFNIGLTTFGLRVNNSASTYLIGADTTQSIPFAFGVADTIFIKPFRVKIQGWSSSVQMSDQADTRVVAGSAFNSSLSIPTATQTIVTGLVASIDTHGKFQSDRYVCGVPGLYQFNANVIIVTEPMASGVYFAKLVKNGVLIPGGSVQFDFASTAFTGGAGQNMSFTPSALVSCNSGDYLQVILYQQAGGARNANISLNVARLSGPSAIAATESVNARYFASATSISTSLATINWTTKDFDSHNSMVSGSYTFAISGKYQINAGLLISGTISLNTTAIMEIQKNGVVVSRNTEYAGGAMTNQKAWVDDIISFLAGDIMTIKVSSSAVAPTIVSSNFDNYVSLARVGN